MKMKHPQGGAVEVADDVAERYEANGWEPVKAPAKKKS